MLHRYWLIHVLKGTPSRFTHGLFMYIHIFSFQASLVCLKGEPQFKRQRNDVMPVIECNDFFYFLDPSTSTKKKFSIEKYVKTCIISQFLMSMDGAGTFDKVITQSLPQINDKLMHYKALSAFISKWEVIKGARENGLCRYLDWAAIIIMLTPVEPPSCLPVSHSLIHS